jgi:hypothetical protein
VQFLLVVALLHYLGAPDVPRLGEREQRLTLLSLSPADQDQAEPKPSSKAPTSSPAAGSAALPVKIENHIPEWRMVPMKLAAAAPASVPVAGTQSGPGAASASGGGAQGYDPYAGASFIRPSDWLTVVGGRPQGAATLDEKVVAELGAELASLLRSHGQANFMITTHSDGRVEQARYVSGTIEAPLRARAERVLVGSRPYSISVPATKEIPLGPIPF